MLRSLNNYILSIFILFILICTNVYGITCNNYEITCPGYPNDWCCPNYQYCGDYNGICYSYTPRTTTSEPSSDFSLGIIVVICVAIGIFFVVCCICCARAQQQQQQQQRLDSSVSSRDSESIAHSYRQRSIHRPIRVAHVQSVYNIGAASSFPSMYEAPPPSYEDAITNLSSTYESTLPSPPVTATVDQMNLQV